MLKLVNVLLQIGYKKNTGIFADAY